MNPGFQVVRRGEATATRWKNGGGVTHELAVWPDGADLSGFDARLSMNHGCSSDVCENT